MTLTFRQELEKIFRKIYPNVSLHGVEDYRTQLAPLDAAGLITKKVQLDILLVLCQRMEDVERKLDDLLMTSKVYVSKPTTKSNTKKIV